ncbi:MAG: tRNA (5-methylaminomethyl-2-thiouridine)(34)-methyltransferase MnmD [Bacteroidales bacterium]|jgi:tRNA U34 5-methylaminomethyl-2-thiouridine-forming methyltransferase MnmC
MIRQLVLTEDGSHSFFVPEMGEHFHSVHGAIQESCHIFIKNGYDRVTADTVTILEIGFGTGLNALLTLMRSKSDRRSVIYESWEAFPLSAEESRQLNYPDLLESGTGIFNQLHAAPWDVETSIIESFKLIKIRGDILRFYSERTFDLVYFDAFGPDFQPDLWTTGIFAKIGSSMKKEAILVTYSAKGQIRRNLREAGFLVEKAPGPPGKREITIAVKK